MPSRSRKKPNYKLFWTILVALFLGIPLFVYLFVVMNGYLNSYQRSTVTDLVAQNCHIHTPDNDRRNNSRQSKLPYDCIVDRKSYGWPVVAELTYIKTAVVDRTSGERRDVPDEELATIYNTRTIRGRARGWPVENGIIVVAAMISVVYIVYHARRRWLSSRNSR